MKIDFSEIYVSEDGDIVLPFNTCVINHQEQGIIYREMNGDFSVLSKSEFLSKFKVIPTGTKTEFIYLEFFKPKIDTLLEVECDCGTEALAYMNDDGDFAIVGDVIDDDYDMDYNLGLTVTYWRYKV